MLLIQRGFACCFVLIFIGASERGVALGQEAGVSITSDFVGGNIRVRSIEDDVVHLEPDLRGGREWFYWAFEVETRKARQLTFEFPEKQMTYVAMQGPAISLDEGKTWNWLGAEHATGSSFDYEFEANQTVRFAVTIPYLQTDLDRFLEEHADNPHLSVTTLTESLGNRPVELLKIGQEADGRVPVLMTARHHACESMASFLLEGLMREALSDSDEGAAFRDKFLLYVVPIVDKDGVQTGDQGKNRRPHDHNRDYGPEPHYPEVAAIIELGKEVKFEIAVDFHCPTLWMDYHQVIYFVGPRDTPESNLGNVTRFANRLKTILPTEAPRGCLVLLKSERTPGHFSDHFAHQEQSVMAMTLEFPYAPRGKRMDPDSCVEYGCRLLAAWNETEFESR